MDKNHWQNLITQKGWWAAYSAYLSSKEWKTKRENRLKIDNGECRTCGSKEDLEIHHKPQAYNKIPNESVNDDLTTLCATCHLAITNSIRERRYSDRDIKINPILPRGAESELLSYGLENSEVQINGRKPPDISQWRSCEPAEPHRESSKENLWKTEQDRGRFRGIGKT